MIENLRHAAAPAAPAPTLAAVVIGRNEGERLRRCLDSLQRRLACVVYVDSGSSDGSLEHARARGVHTVELDMSVPFTAARARNAGFARALEVLPALDFVQFVDGDCEVVEGWLDRGLATIAAQPALAVVCGRRAERYPAASVYNRLCDIEWRVPAGPARSCGGDAIMRVVALRAVGGYRPDLIAGEEPELCVRLRAAGWQVQVLDAEMTLHDADMKRLRQWWLRTVRAGYAYAEGVQLHGRAPERHFVRELRRALGWSLGPPAVALAALPVAGWSAVLLVLAVYPLQLLRLARRAAGTWPQRLQHGLFLVLGKFAECQGAWRYHRMRLAGRAGRLIEYK